MSGDRQLEALQALVVGVRLAQSRGCYTLEEAHALCSSMLVFTDQATDQATDSQEQVTEPQLQKARPKRKTK